MFFVKEKYMKFKTKIVPLYYVITTVKNMNNFDDFLNFLPFFAKF